VGGILPELEAVFAVAGACTKCPGMGCAPVLSAANGRVSARVMFVGEAPGRFGAGRTGIPFSGDVAGARFERLLGEAGLQRPEVFVTNSLLCLPLDAKGRNRTPTAREIRACIGWLARTVASVDPAIVVAMGRVALEALRGIESHGLQLADAGGGPEDWSTRKLAVVYHPGARSQAHRCWADQVRDWRLLGEAIRVLQSGAGDGRLRR